MPENTLVNATRLSISVSVITATLWQWQSLLLPQRLCLSSPWACDVTSRTSNYSLGEKLPLWFPSSKRKKPTSYMPPPPQPPTSKVNSTSIWVSRGTNSEQSPVFIVLSVEVLLFIYAPDPTEDQGKIQALCFHRSFSYSSQILVD